MMFTIGDLIVLLLVVIILVVYRQLDRNNRSIDKVKRFVERAQLEMDEVVSEKVTMLKDIGIELEVHQKAAREVLKRIQTIEDQLNSRSGAMEEIDKRLGEYERALRELVQMTQRTEENIARVKEESEYVDKVGRRIKAVQGRVDEMEASLPNIVSGFETQNIDRMEKVERTFFAREEERMQRLDGRINGAAGRVQEFSEQVAQLQAETDEQVQTARTDFRELAESLERGFEERSSELTRDATQTISDARDEAVQTARDVREQQELIRSEMESVIDQMRGLLEDQFQEYRERIDELARRGTALETEALTALRSHLAENIENLRKDSEERNASVFSETEALMHSSISSLKEHLDGRVEEIRGESDTAVFQFKSRVDELTSDFDDWKERTKQYVSELEQQVNALETETLRSESEQRNALETYISELNERFDRNRQVVEQSFAHLKEELDRHAGEFSEEQLASIERLRSQAEAKEKGFQIDLAELEAAVQAQHTALGERQQETQTAISEYVRNNEERIAELNEQIVQFTSSFGDRISRDEQALEQQVLSGLEKRLSDYEQELNYRFERIESVNADVDELEQAMRRTMERVSERIRSDFRVFGDEMQQQRQSDKNAVETQVAALQEEIDQLESGLNKLKERAYVSVSEKLKIFEDDFFADLRTRSEKIDQRITDWNEEVEGQLRRLTMEAQEERRGYEDEQNRKLVEHLSGLSEEMRSRLRKSEEQIELFQTNLAGRIEGAEKNLDSFHEVMKTEIEESADQIKDEYRQELQKHDTQLRGELKDFTGTFSRSLNDVRQELSDGSAELEQMVEAVRSDVTLWQTRVLNQLQSSEASMESSLADFKVTASENLHHLRQEYTSERERLISESEAERSRITSEIERLSRSLVELEKALDERSETALQDFSDQFVQLKGDMDGYRVSVLDTIEAHTSEFRSFIVDTREQMVSMQAKQFGRIDEESKLLSVNLEEIEKRQKSFIEQTQIFERADALKIQLESQIGELKGEISRVESSRTDIREIEAQFNKIQRTATEASEKMSRFMAEKRRIDLIEEDYKRLITLSQSAESKLDRINSSEDRMQEIGAYLKSLEELQSEVSDRFDRLEKRRQMIDRTVDALEENGQRLHELETRLTTVQDDLAVLPEQVQKLSGQIETLLRNRPGAENAIQQMTRLESTLQEIEARMAKLQTAREWLAGTETRLEQIQREAGEQVKLLGTLLREEVKKEPVGAGAPTSPVRETIQKLARQGWKVDEIARATKVSKGEVELILELSSRSS